MKTTISKKKNASHFVKVFSLADTWPYIFTGFPNDDETWKVPIESFALSVLKQSFRMKWLRPQYQPHFFILIASRIRWHFIISFRLFTDANTLEYNLPYSRFHSTEFIVSSTFKVSTNRTETDPNAKVRSSCSWVSSVLSSIRSVWVKSNFYGFEQSSTIVLNQSK